MTLTYLEPSLRTAEMPRPAALRILLVTARYLPYMGGTEMHVHEVGRRLAAAGNEVTVLTADPGGTLPAAEDVDGMHIIRVKAWPAKRDYYFAPGIFQVIARDKWDVVHLQGYHTLVAPMTMLAAWRANIPYVVTFHSGGHSSQFRNMGRTLQRTLLRPFLNHAAKLVGVSNFEADFFASQLHFSRNRFQVIQNGANLLDLDAAPVKDNDEVLIVSVGRLERYKRHQAVISAFPYVLNECPNARLRIVGSGPYEDDLRQLVAELGLDDKVTIGAVPPGNRQEMARILSGAALVTLLSEYEAHPIAVMEALSVKRSVLVADTSGLHELAERGLVRSIPLNSTDKQVAAAIVAQLRNPLIPATVDLPTWDDCAANLQNLYREVIEQ